MLYLCPPARLLCFILSSLLCLYFVRLHVFCCCHASCVNLGCFYSFSNFPCAVQSCIYNPPVCEGIFATSMYTDIEGLYLYLTQCASFTGIRNKGSEQHTRVENHAAEQSSAFRKYKRRCMQSNTHRLTTIAEVKTKVWFTRLCQ